MIFGFDLDGTLDRPELAQLANLLYDTGHQIHVITASRIDTFGYRATREDKVKKLAKLKVNYTKLHLAEGRTFSEVGLAKAKVINEVGAHIMFDDSTTFCNMMADYTDAVILRVREANEREG